MASPPSPGSKRPAPSDWESTQDIPEAYRRSGAPSKRPRMAGGKPQPDLFLRDPNRDIVLGSNKAPKRVLFAERASFRNPFELDQDWRDDHKLVIKILAEPHPGIRITETRILKVNGSEYAKKASVFCASGCFEVIYCDYQRDDIFIDNDHIYANNWFDIVIKSQTDLHVTSENFGGYDVIKQVEALPPLLLNQSAVTGRRYIKLSVRDPNQAAEKGFWHEQTVRDNLALTRSKRAENDWKTFLRLQKDALGLEAEQSMSRLEKLERKNCIARIAPAATGLHGRFQVTLSSPDDEAKGVSWVVPEGSLVYLQADEVFVPEDAQKPQRLGKWQEGTWEAKLFDWGPNIALIENPVPASFPCREVQNVKVTIMMEDPTFVKMNKLLDTAHNFFHVEDPSTSSASRANSIAKHPEYRLKIPLLPVLMDSNGSFAPGPRLRLKLGRQEFDLERQGLQLLQKHREALRKLVSGHAGLTFVQGPPATGKTELVFKMICLILEQVHLGKEQIVVSAKTNRACFEIAARLCHKMQSMFNMDPEKEVCLYQTDSISTRHRKNMTPLDRFAQRLSLDQHIFRLATKTGDNLYLGMWKEMQEHGCIKDEERYKAYIRQRQKYNAKVRGSVKVIICTLAATTSNFFVKEVTGDDNQEQWERQVETNTLIIDEASQAETPSILLTWIRLNPGRIVFTGDQIQLAPYAETSMAKLVYNPSLMERLEYRGFPQTMLDEQFRTVENLYRATSKANYGNQVRTNELATTDRPCYKTLVAGLTRVHFVDSLGRKFYPRNNSQFFNIVNGKSQVSGETKSSYNDVEVAFIAGFVATLKKIGLNDRDILLLTSYKAQVERLSKIKGNSDMGAGVVDGYQGGEANLVILSMVRTDKNPRNIGFQGQRNRQNVMTSRPKDAQFFVGKWELFKDAAKWQVYLETLEAAHFKFVITFKAPVKWYIDGQLVEF
ncbi:MAG: hypothetical protein Q9227_002214 [Pyrenula ochraceoflavens]